MINLAESKVVSFIDCRGFGGSRSPPGDFEIGHVLAKLGNTPGLQGLPVIKGTTKQILEAIHKKLLAEKMA